MASIRIKDELDYKKYLDAAGEVFSKYNGLYLAVDNSAEVVEGSWDYSRAVLIRFESRKDFYAWYQSDEYQQILSHRLRAADCDSILMKG
jgi:uncharacterized protein (DUF1330 family)